MSKHAFIRASAFPIEQLIEESAQRAEVLHHLIQSKDQGICAAEVGISAASLSARVSELRHTYRLSIYAVSKGVSDGAILKGEYTRFYLRTHTIEQFWHAGAA